MPKKIPGSIKKISKEYFKTTSTMLISAFGLVAALAWNEFIKKFIAVYIEPGATLGSHFIYALIVTIFVVIMTIYLGSIAKRLDKEEDI